MLYDPEKNYAPLINFAVAQFVGAAAAMSGSKLFRDRKFVASLSRTLVWATRASMSEVNWVTRSVDIKLDSDGVKVCGTLLNEDVKLENFNYVATCIGPEHESVLTSASTESMPETRYVDYRLDNGKWLRTSLAGNTIRDVGEYILEGTTGLEIEGGCDGNDDLQRYARRAAAIWRKLLEKPEYKNLCPEEEHPTEVVMCQMLAEMAPRNNTADVLNKFESALFKLTLERLKELDLRQKGAGDRRGWVPPYLHIRVDYGPDLLLRSAADEAGLDMEFPWKTDMNIDLERKVIDVSAGYRAPPATHHLCEEGWLVCQLAGEREDVEKVIEIARGNKPKFDLFRPSFDLVPELERAASRKT